MYEKWPNALELPLGQEEGSREAQSKEKSERVGRRTTLSGSSVLPETQSCVQRCAGSGEARAYVFNAVMCCTKRLLSAVVGVALSDGFPHPHFVFHVSCFPKSSLACAVIACRGSP